MHRGEFILILVWAIGLTCFFQLKGCGATSQVADGEGRPRRRGRVAPKGVGRGAGACCSLSHRICRYDCLIQLPHLTVPHIYTQARLQRRFDDEILNLNDELRLRLGYTDAEAAVGLKAYAVGSDNKPRFKRRPFPVTAEAAQSATARRDAVLSLFEGQSLGQIGKSILIAVWAIAMTLCFVYSVHGSEQ